MRIMQLLTNSMFQRMLIVGRLALNVTTNEDATTFSCFDVAILAWVAV